MIESHNAGSIPAMSGNNLDFEINWNNDVTDAIKFKIAGNESIIKKADLYNFLFAVADETLQEKLMPTRQTRITKYIKQHRVMAKKDIRKGESLIVNCEIDVPTTIEEGLGFLGRRRSKFAI